MDVINKNVPAKWDEMFIYEKKLPTKAGSWFYESEIAVRWEN